MNTQAIPILAQDGHVSALGHRVRLDDGGVAELKRRCLETLSRLKDPPDEIRFELSLVGNMVLAAALAPPEREPSPSDRHPDPRAQQQPQTAGKGRKAR